MYGLRDVGLRALQFFVNCRRAVDAYGAACVGLPQPRAGLGGRKAEDEVYGNRVEVHMQPHFTERLPAPRRVWGAAPQALATDFIPSAGASDTPA